MKMKNTLYWNMFIWTTDKQKKNKQMKQWNVVSDLYMYYITYYKKMIHWVNKNTFFMYSILNLHCFNNL